MAAHFERNKWQRKINFKCDIWYHLDVVHHQKISSVELEGRWKTHDSAPKTDDFKWKSCAVVGGGMLCRLQAFRDGALTAINLQAK